MVKREVLGKLIDNKKSAILQTILHSSEEMYLKEISNKSSVSLTSTFRILQELVDLEIIQKKEWKTSKVYSCKENPQVEFLKSLFHEEFDGVHEFIERVKNMPSIQSIIQHGNQKKGQANLLILGKDIPTDPLDQKCIELKKRGFELSYLTLTKDQYEQMVKMGLYSKEKKVLH